MSLFLINELHKLNRQQWMSKEDLEAITLSKLKRQVSLAWEFSPFYRKHFAAIDFQPEDLRSLSDLQFLPIIHKSDILAAGEDLYNTGIKSSNSVWLKTSGSSGSPLSLPFMRQDKDRRALKELRALFANGYKMTDRMLIFVEPRCLVECKGLPQRLGLMRRNYVSIFDPEHAQIAKIKSHRPHVIYGYTSTLRILAEAILSGRNPIHSPKILMSSAELLDPVTRRLLKNAFGAEPLDFYGSMEFGWIAWQCEERNGYHINSDCLIVELLQDGTPVKPGEEGELVITNLHSDAAPLIRYATGDVGTLGRQKCSCGRALPLLSSIHGRLVDFVLSPDGRKLSPYSVTCAVEDIPGVQQFQVVQESILDIKVRLLGANGVDDERIRSAVTAAIGFKVRVSVERVSRLPLEPNGKFKVVKSDVYH
ncbi:MAG: hypothetical protein Q7N50_14055 [Armatimonadota bacterium]|nr:hypothetical protein [Armatimonadota bacterium]